MMKSGYWNPALLLSRYMSTCTWGLPLVPAPWQNKSLPGDAWPSRDGDGALAGGMLHTLLTSQCLRSTEEIRPTAFRRFIP